MPFENDSVTLPDLLELDPPLEETSSPQLHALYSRSLIREYLLEQLVRADGEHRAALEGELERLEGEGRARA